MNVTHSFNVPQGALGTPWPPHPAADEPNGKPQDLIIDPTWPLSRITAGYAGPGIGLALARPHPRTGRPQDTHRAGSRWRNYLQ